MRSKIAEADKGPLKKDFASIFSFSAATCKIDGDQCVICHAWFQPDCTVISHLNLAHNMQLFVPGFCFVCLFLFVTWCPAPWYLHVQLHWIHSENCVTNMTQHVRWSYNLTDNAKHTLQLINLHVGTRNLNLRVLH